MSYGLIDDELHLNRKVRGFTSDEFRLWMMAISYSRKHKTHGHLTEDDVNVVATGQLLRRPKVVLAGLLRKHGFDQTPEGYRVHDWDAMPYDREPGISAKRAVAGREGGVRNRARIWRESPFGQQIIARDGGVCRYCDIPVDEDERWNGARGLTFDHVDPVGGNDAENVVVACRTCNSKLVPISAEEKRHLLHPPRGNIEAIAFPHVRTRAGTPSPTPPPKREIETPNGVSKESQRVFDTWAASKGNPPGLRLTKDRARVIEARLREGYSAEDLEAAACGWQNDPWEGRPQQNDLRILLRDGGQVEKFGNLWRNGPPAVILQNRALSAGRDWMQLADQLREAGQ